jgi:hypothetical protein
MESLTKNFVLGSRQSLSSQRLPQPRGQRRRHNSLCGVEVREGQIEIGE